MLVYHLMIYIRAALVLFFDPTMLRKTTTRNNFVLYIVQSSVFFFFTKNLSASYAVSALLNKQTLQCEHSLAGINAWFFKSLQWNAEEQKEDKRFSRFSWLSQSSKWCRKVVNFYGTVLWGYFSPFLRFLLYYSITHVSTMIKCFMCYKHNILKLWLRRGIFS